MRSDTKKISGNHKIYLHTFIEKNERRMKKKGKKKKKNGKEKLGEHYGQVKILSKIHNSFFVQLKMNSDDPKTDSFFPNQEMRVMPSILKVEYMQNMGIKSR